MDPIAESALSQLLSQIRLGQHDSGGTTQIIGSDPVVPSRHRLGTASAVALAAQGTAIAAIWKMRSGRGQDVTVEVRRAAVPGLRTVYALRQHGYSVHARPPGDGVNFFRARDGRRMYILRTIAYPRPLMKLLDLLECSNSAEAFATAVSRWRSDDLEEAIAEKKLFGTIARTREEWLAHPQGQWLAARPPVEIEKMAEVQPNPSAQRHVLLQGCE